MGRGAADGAGVANLALADLLDAARGAGADAASKEPLANAPNALKQGAEAPLDVPFPSLYAALAPLRERLWLKVAKRLEDYDAQPSFPRPQDEEHRCRDGYEEWIYSEGLKDLREAIATHLNSGPCPGQIWRILGGRNGGIVVRAGAGYTSPVMSERLAKGAWVEEEALVGDRLRYWLVKGSGPKVGWISTNAGGRALAERIDSVPQSVVRAGRASNEPSEELLAMVNSATTEAELSGASLVPGRVVILGLMAAHIKTRERLERLRHALASVRAQDVAQADAEFIAAVSWYAVDPELAASAEELFAGFSTSGEREPGRARVAARQERPCSQFQHLQAALSAAEAELRARLRRCDPAGRNVSVWVVFGDDDDIWHPSRVGMYARAIQAHAMREGVAVFATLTRANLTGTKKYTMEEMPKTQAEVEALIPKKHCRRMDQDQVCMQWMETLRAAGKKAPTLAARLGLPIEYFDLCPRLRVLQEFLESTSPQVLAHRYCDLRFDEFAMGYPRRGREAGLEVSFFAPELPDCWMYFYANAGMSNYQLSLSLEMPGDQPVAYIGSDDGGHVSTKVDVEPSDVDQAGLMVNELRPFALKSATVLQLTRYLAAFRNHLECILARLHQRKIDQRVLDYQVNEAYKASFDSFRREVAQLDRAKRTPAKATVYRLCEGYGSQLARRFHVDILWHDTAKPLQIPADGDEDLDLSTAVWDGLAIRK